MNSEEEKRSLKFVGLMSLCVGVGFVAVRLLGARHLDWKVEQPLTVWISVWTAALSLVTYGFVVFCLIRYVVQQFSKKREKNPWRRIAYMVGATACIPVAGIFMSYQAAVIWREGFSPDPLLRTLIALILFLFSAGWTFEDLILGPLNATEDKSIKDRSQAGFADFIFIVLAIMAGWGVFDSVKSQVDYLVSSPKAVDVRQQKSVNANSPVVDAHKMLVVPRSAVLMGVKGSPVALERTDVGSGVIAKTRIGEHERVILITARHVANMIHALRGKLEIGYMTEKAIERRVIDRMIWLVDEDTDDDLAILDVSDLGLEDRAIDLDGNTDVKVARLEDFDLCGIKAGCQAVAVCGSPRTGGFDLKCGWYIRELDGFAIFAMNVVPGNSGSPVFAFMNNVLYFVGIYSAAIRSDFDGLVAAPLDNVFRLLERGDKRGYFDPAVRNGMKEDDFTRAFELMKRKGVPFGNFGPSPISWRMPHDFVSIGVHYTIERDAPQSCYFKIVDPNGNVVDTGRFRIFPSEFDARRQAFAYACTKLGFTMERLEQKVVCRWVDETKGVLTIVGATGVGHLIAGNLLITLHNRNPMSLEIAIDLANAMHQ